MFGRFPYPISTFIAVYSIDQLRLDVGCFYLLPMMSDYKCFFLSDIFTKLLFLFAFVHLVYLIVNGRFGKQLHSTLSTPRHLVLPCFVFYFDAVWLCGTGAVSIVFLNTPYLERIPLMLKYWKLTCISGAYIWTIFGFLPFKALRC